MECGHFCFVLFNGADLAFTWTKLSLFERTVKPQVCYRYLKKISNFIGLKINKLNSIVPERHGIHWEIQNICCYSSIKWSHRRLRFTVISAIHRKLQKSNFSSIHVLNTWWCFRWLNCHWTTTCQSVLQ